MKAPSPNPYGYYYPNSDNSRTYKTGDATPFQQPGDYNCFGWALGLNRWFFPYEFGGSGTVADVEYYMADHGYAEVGSDEDWDIVFWARPGGNPGIQDDEVTHAATRSSHQPDSYIWVESKMGAQERIVTRMTDLDNSCHSYGAVLNGNRVLYFRLGD
ncbi:MAG TPA: hypothetical protein PLQ35_14895 [bacterium]|nr:hypothetical protein [bacterium]HQL63572.1 hypothetical protein [bacterium]